MHPQRKYLGYARRLLAGAFAAGLLLATGNVEAAETTIVVNGSGGAAQEAIDEAFDAPFTEETGIRVQATAPMSLPKLKVMVETGNIEWDVTELDGTIYNIARENGWLEPIDYSVVDPDGVLPDIAKKEFALVTVVYSTVWAYRTDKFPDGGPATWADFWDVAAFPGPRSLQNSVQTNLEFALLADGVAKEDIYAELSTPAGIDRAFAKLDEIKPHIVKWWSAGAEPVQMLADGEAFLSTAWNGRIASLQEQGTPVTLVWNGGGLNLGFLGIPRGAKHIDEAMLYLHYWTRPELMANFAKLIPYPGFVPGLTDYLDPEYAKELPTYSENAAVQFEVDEGFWAEHREELTNRWNEWLLQ
jgi:putative spermidine/putrescine transport system substrate-binding protein